MHKRCLKCDAFHFKAELEGRVCCHHGSVKIPPIQPWPVFLDALYRGVSHLTPEQKAILTVEEAAVFTSRKSVTSHFHRCVRKYNNAVSPASFQADYKHISGHGPATINIHGQIYRRLPHLLPGQRGDQAAVQYAGDGSVERDGQLNQMGEEDVTVLSVLVYASVVRIVVWDGCRQSLLSCKLCRTGMA